MKSKSNRRKLAIVICNFNLAAITSVKTDDSRFRLDDADMTIVLVWSVLPVYLMMTQECLSYFCIG